MQACGTGLLLGVDADGIGGMLCRGTGHNCQPPPLQLLNPTRCPARKLYQHHHRAVVLLVVSSCQPLPAHSRQWFKPCPPALSPAPGASRGRVANTPDTS